MMRIIFILLISFASVGFSALPSPVQADTQYGGGCSYSMCNGIWDGPAGCYTTGASLYDETSQCTYYFGVTIIDHTHTCADSGQVGIYPDCSTPPPSCAANSGQSCSASNSCGTGTGTFDCNGNCSAVAPSCPLPPSCVANAGQSCSVSNSCGMTGSGSVACDGTCSAVAPSDSFCTSCVPNEGSACTSSANSCGMTNTGSIQCSGSCSATTPPESLCVSGGPDFTTSGSNITVASGALTNLTYLINNIGTAASSGNFKNFIWVDADATHTSDVTTWGTKMPTPGGISGPNPMAAGTSLSGLLPWTAPSVSSVTTNWYYVCADWNGSIVETNENNNCSAGGIWNTITINPPGGATVSLVATPNPVNSGGSALLTWTSTNATSCTGSGFSTGGATVNSTGVSTGPLMSQATYQITCTGAGAPAVASVTVNVNPAPAPSCGTPALSISASKTRVAPNTPVTITWSATGIAQNSTCTVTGKGIGSGTTPDSQTTPPAPASCVIAQNSKSVTITGQQIYTITCSGVSASQTVIVNTIPDFKEF